MSTDDLMTQVFVTATLASVFSANELVTKLNYQHVRERWLSGLRRRV